MGIAVLREANRRMKIGWIGLGQMGTGMARSLLKAGYPVTVFNRTRKRAEELEPDGAKVARDVAEASSGDVVITMLADDPAVEGAVFSKDGILENLRGTHVSMSTISPALVARMTKAHQERGCTFVSAPVLGRPDAAAEARLSIVAAGPKAEIDRLKPIFSALGKKLLIAGEEPAAANYVKISCNLLIATLIEGLSETFSLIRKSKLVEPAKYAEILGETVLGGGAIFKPYLETIPNENYKPGFRAPLALKDIELVLDANKEIGAPMPIASLLRDRLLALIASGDGDLDWSAVAKIAARDAGLLRSA